MNREFDEIWKDIKTIPYHQAEWPFHQVSNKGRIRVLPGGKVLKRLVVEIELRKLRLHNKGYPIVKQGTREHLVHVLVLNQFYGPCPPGQECCHLNGNPSDNRWPENLEWGTHKKNMEDKIRHGTDNTGERNGRSLLRESDVVEIRDRLSRGESNVQLALEYSVANSTISHIRNNRIWKKEDE